MSDYPKWICAGCGEKHGRKLGSIVPGLSLSTYHDGDPADPTDRCGWCGSTEGLTEPRDYGYPPKPVTFSQPVEPGSNQQNEEQNP